MVFYLILLTIFSFLFSIGKLIAELKELIRIVKIMNEKKTRNLAIIALVLSVLALLLQGMDIYNQWYVPKRAELSIIFTKFSYSTDNPLTVNASGLITNEGSRTTLIKDAEARFTFPTNKSTTIMFSIGYSPYNAIPIGKETLTIKEYTNFNYTGLIWQGQVSHYGVSLSNFTEFEIVITHDDGIGSLTNSASRSIIH